MNKFHIRVADLQVVAYTRIKCPHNPQHTWNLSKIPVTCCAYYQCVKMGQESFFNGYIDLWAVRKPGVTTDHTYGKFLKLVEQVRGAKGYSDELAGSEPMRIHRGTTCLYDGHHRAAIICALFGPGILVPVEEGTDAYPQDLDLCARGLPPMP